MHGFSGTSAVAGLKPNIQMQSHRTPFRPVSPLPPVSPPPHPWSPLQRYASTLLSQFTNVATHTLKAAGNKINQAVGSVLGGHGGFMPTNGAVTQFGAVAGGFVGAAVGGNFSVNGSGFPSSNDGDVPLLGIGVYE